MKYELSYYALVRLQERKIDFAWFERTITQPQKTEPDVDDPALERRLAAIAKLNYRCAPSRVRPAGHSVKDCAIHLIEA